MSLFKIDPISIKKFDEFKEVLKKSVSIDAAKESATQLKDVIENNIRTGYDDPVSGLGYTWPPLSLEREWTLQQKGLIPHEGLVAETQDLVNSLRLDEDGDTFRVNVGRGIDYAFTHEYGGGRGQVPPRPYFYPGILHFKTEETHKKVVLETLKKIKGAH